MGFSKENSCTLFHKCCRLACVFIKHAVKYCDIWTIPQGGEYPTIFKFEAQTPVAKVRPCLKLDQIRISGLLTADKIMESLVSEIMIKDTRDNMDKSQSGNQKVISIQHSV